jgi:hypothetical protein
MPASFATGLDGFVGLIAVVTRQEFELTALDAAHRVRLTEGGRQAVAHADAERIRGPFEDGGLPEQDFLGRNPRVGEGAPRISDCCAKRRGGD